MRVCIRTSCKLLNDGFPLSISGPIAKFRRFSRQSEIVTSLTSLACSVLTYYEEAVSFLKSKGFRRSQRFDLSIASLHFQGPWDVKAKPDYTPKGASQLAFNRLNCPESRCLS